MKFPRILVVLVVSVWAVAGIAAAAQQSAPAAPASSTSAPTVPASSTSAPAVPATATAPNGQQVAAPSPADVSNPVPAPQTPEEAAKVVRDRAKAFYTAILRNNRQAARELVNPDSYEAFDQGFDMHTLSAYLIDNVSADPVAGTATVQVTRHFTQPAAISMPWTDQWKLVNGSWMFTLPAFEYNSPWGKMAPATEPPDEATLQRMLEAQTRAQTKVVADPDQVFKTLEKFQAQQAEQQKAAEAAKAAKEQADAAAKGKKSKKKSKKDAKPTAAKASDNAKAQPGN